MTRPHAQTPSAWFTLRQRDMDRLDAPILPRRTLRMSRRFIGAVLAGRYRIVRPHADVGLGAVFVALDMLSGDEVLLKVLQAPPGALSAELFERLSSAITGTRAPHVAPVAFVGLVEQRPFVVTKGFSGETLRARLDANGPLSTADALALTIQLLDALTAVHANGLIHGNVKPENVLVTSPRGALLAIQLLDLGVTSLLAGGEPMSANENASLGTPPYLSPEQLGGVPDLDARVDVWAAALVCHEALTARRAYAGASLHEVSVRIAFQPAPRCGIPALDVVLTRALAKRRDERFGSAAEFRSALLDACIDAWDESPSSQSTVPAPPESVFRCVDPADDAEAPTDLHLDIAVEL